MTVGIKRPSEREIFIVALVDRGEIFYRLFYLFVSVITGMASQRMRDGIFCEDEVIVELNTPIKQRTDKRKKQNELSVKTASLALPRRMTGIDVVEENDGIVKKVDDNGETAEVTKT